MRTKSHKQNRKAGTGKHGTGILAGGTGWATVGWLTAPQAGAKTRHRFRGEVMSARDRAEYRGLAPVIWQKRSAMEMNSED